jgi:hypothetical protein
MNASTVARHYDRLTAEERFRLIVAASDRGDEAERHRLVGAGQRICLSMPDHAPYAQAFDELARLVFIELLEEAAQYLDFLAQADDAQLAFGDNADADGVEAEEVNRGTADDEPGSTADPESQPRNAGERSLAQRYLDIALATGFVLRTKAEGWKLFCERLAVPPFVFWKGLPGFGRLARALTLSETVAFAPEGFLRWLNTIRPAGEPERTEVPWTVEGLAAVTEDLFRQSVRSWSGSDR